MQQPTLDGKQTHTRRKRVFVCLRVFDDIVTGVTQAIRGGAAGARTTCATTTGTIRCHALAPPRLECNTTWHSVTRLFCQRRSNNLKPSVDVILCSRSCKRSCRLKTCSPTSNPASHCSCQSGRRLSPWGHRSPRSGVSRPPRGSVLLILPLLSL